jgi:hypothetical protein
MTKKEVYNKLHNSYCDKLQTVVDILEDESLELAPENLIRCAAVLRAAHLENISAIIMMNQQLQVALKENEDMQTKLNKLN